MLYLINIHWRRRSPHPDKPARTLTAAKNKAIKKFNRHLGTHLAIEKTTEVPDPAGIFQ